MAVDNYNNQTWMTIPICLIILYKKKQKHIFRKILLQNQKFGVKCLLVTLAIVFAVLINGWYLKVTSTQQNNSLEIRCGNKNAMGYYVDVGPFS